MLRMVPVTKGLPEWDASGDSDESTSSTTGSGELSLQGQLHLKLLLYKSGFFVAGVALLIAGGVASHYISPSSHLDC